MPLIRSRRRDSVGFPIVSPISGCLHHGTDTSCGSVRTIAPPSAGKGPETWSVEDPRPNRKAIAASVSRTSSQKVILTATAARPTILSGMLTSHFLVENACSCSFENHGHPERKAALDGSRKAVFESEEGTNQGGRQQAPVLKSAA